MPKEKSIILNVPQPCHEDWEKMTSNERGRHCASCSKTVVDFSNYTDRELAAFLKNVSGSVCGRLNNYQVNRPILLTEQPNRSFIHKLFLGTALASWFGFVGTANAQTNNTIPPVQQKDSNQQRNSDKKESNKPNADSVISGIANDSATHQPIPFANVVIEFNNEQICGAVTDIDGKFILNLPGKYVNSHLQLKCSYEGYEVCSKPIRAISSSIQLLMKEERGSMTTGILIINYGRPFNTTYKTIFDRNEDDSPYLSPRPHNK